jgi:hypothetical protein
VHLNGRVYDPLLARMTSADPTVTDPMNPQGWNRYSYVGNDPLAFTDPNGFSWLSSFFRSVTNFFCSNPIARAILQIASTIILNAILPGSGVLLAVAAAAGGAAIATGLSGGNLGQILRASAIAGITAAAFYGVGEITNAAAGYEPTGDMPAHFQPTLDTPGAYGVNVAGHALVGCASSVASGGSCQSGALSAGVSAGAGPFINTSNQVASLVRNTVVGGLASVAGGGKFANGAITGAFGYMFNNKAGKIIGGIVGGLLGAAATGPEDVGLEIAGAAAGAKFGDWLTGPEQLGSFSVPEGLKFGTTVFGNYAHLAVTDLLQAQYPDANFAFSVRPGQIGVDVEVLGQSSINAVGFQYGEIKPLTPSGEASFNRQVQNWSLSAPVQAITYDAKGRVYMGFR